MRPLVIGVGNDFAGDDVAGREVARALAGVPGLDVVQCHGAAADLVTLMEGRGHVVIVDAARSGAAVGTLHELDAGALPGWLRAVSSHGIGVAEGVALARLLGSLPARVEVFAIEGAAFATGDEVSAAVGAAVARLADRLRARFSGL